MSVPELRDLESLLQPNFEAKISILDYDTKLLTAPGENYGGVILAVNATIKPENSPPEPWKFVAKLCPANEKLCEIFKIDETFKKEQGAYLKVIPAFAAFEEEFGIDQDKFSDMFAKCLGGRINLDPKSDCLDKKNAVLLMENLKIAGYDVEDRLIGFDLEHSEMILRNLGHFHAVPVAMKILKPEVFREKVLPSCQGVYLGDSFDEETTVGITTELFDILKTDKECLQNWDRIKELIMHGLTGPYRTLEAKDPFATLVHTDFWVNNTMILKDKNEKPIHNKIVDLQLLYHNSPMHDLLFFLFSSVVPKVMEENFDHLVKVYYDAFVERLKKYKIDVTPFSWKIFEEEMKEIAPLELGHIFFMYKPILTERGNIDDMAKFDTETMLKKDIMSEDYEKRILNTALWYIRHNWL